ncbi:effector-associated constant component EACC1 [Streptomyces sp. B1-3]|uniref:effector-associated constant component EACC1 n=1 Tax=Streptomyces sp. B1-3 TaxID=3141453 RepID=UPI003D2E0D40
MSGGAEDELRSLAQWLSADPGVRRHAQVEFGAASPVTPGHQGDTIDLLSLLLSSGFSASSLALSVMAWRATRPVPPTLVVERPDGVRVEISGQTPDEAQELMRRVLGE